MRFGVLGPVMVESAGTRIEIPSAQLRALLAALLADANTTVPVGDLKQALWGDDPPASAKASLHNQVMRLRRHLGPEVGARIRTVAPGYLIEVHEGELDEQVFVDQCARGRNALRTGDWAAAAADLTAALALWRGDPGADLPDNAAVTARVHRLTEIRLQALQGRIDAELHQGHHQEVIAEISILTSDYPLIEAFHGQLMLALYRSGRQAQALDTFQVLRRTLIDELGVEPSPPLQQLHRRILSADAELALAPPAPSAAGGSESGESGESDGSGGSADSTQAGRSSRRFQLPADTRVFTGRERELDQLIDLARETPDAGMVMICAVDGMAGIGKSSLAVHAAHRVRDRFPDGQLFIDLHGYTSGLDPMPSGDALDWLLHSLGVPPQMVPHDLDERAAFYRDRLDGTRTLIILDDASSTAQVRPLLPASPGCLVLVTSRKRLAGLDDAHSLALDMLPTADSVALLHKVAGPDRIPAHHPAIPELIRLCGNMPLAIRITAARLRHHRALRIEDVVGQLRDERSRLDRLRDEDRNLTAVFDLSYRALPAAEQHLFRRLGLSPGSDFDAYAAAALAAAGHRTAERLLESLLDHNLLVQHIPGRYRFHDLMRVYARNLGESDPAEVREGAVEGLLDFYQYTAQVADHYLTRHTRPGPVRVVPRPAAAPEPTDRISALAWIRAEGENLLACIAYAAGRSRPERVLGLTAALAAFLHQEGPWPQATSLHIAAAAAAHELGDQQSEANALWDLGRIRFLTGDLAAAAGLLERALELYRDLGDRLGEATALWDLGRVRGEARDYPASAELHIHALAIYQDLGNQRGEANAMHDLSRALHMTGDYAAAAGLHKQALEIYQNVGDRLGEATALCDLGRVLHETGDYPGAASLHEEALEIYQDLGNHHGKAITLLSLGQVRHAAGDYPAASSLHKQALDIYHDVGHRHGEAEVLNSMATLVAETTGSQEALALYRQALQLAREAQSPLEEARALDGAAHCLARLGDRGAALADLREAVALYQRIGAAEAATGAAALAALESGEHERGKLL